MESKSNSFNCIIAGCRCTKCCEVIHIPNQGATRIVKKQLADSDAMINKYWRRISKRIAKKRNPEMFSDAWPQGCMDWIDMGVGFFKCLALKNGECTIYQDRPDACKDFNGDGFYNVICSNDYHNNEE